MSVALAVALGGAVGTLSRHGLDSFIEQRTASAFPWATFVINVSRCHHAPAWLRAGLVVGFCGGYTTFDVRPGVA